MKWLRNINIVWIFSYGVAGILQTGVFGVIMAENLPRTGAVGLNLMGGAGMFGVSIYMIIMGGYYDKLTINHLPAGADLTTYTQAAAGSTMANSLNDAKSMAGIDLFAYQPSYPNRINSCFWRIGIIHAQQEKEFSFNIRAT